MIIEDPEDLDRVREGDPAVIEYTSPRSDRVLTIEGTVSAIDGPSAPCWEWLRIEEERSGKDDRTLHVDVIDHDVYRHEPGRNNSRGTIDQTKLGTVVHLRINVADSPNRTMEGSR